MLCSHLFRNTGYRAWRSPTQLEAIDSTLRFDADAVAYRLTMWTQVQNDREKMRAIQKTRQCFVMARRIYLAPVPDRESPSAWLPVLPGKLPGRLRAPIRSGSLLRVRDAVPYTCS
jgi:hypothetical protein